MRRFENVIDDVLRNRLLVFCNGEWIALKEKQLRRLPVEFVGSLIVQAHAG